MAVIPQSDQLTRLWRQQTLLERKQKLEQDMIERQLVFTQHRFTAIHQLDLELAETGDERDIKYVHKTCGNKRSKSTAMNSSTSVKTRTRTAEYINKTTDRWVGTRFEMNSCRRITESVYQIEHVYNENDINPIEITRPQLAQMLLQTTQKYYVFI